MTSSVAEKPFSRIACLAVILILYISLFNTVTYQVFMDEFFEYGSGMKLFKWGHFSESFFNHGIINPIITEICAHVSGREMSFFAARFFQLAMGLLSVVATFYLALMFFPIRIAFISSLFLLISPYFNISTHRILSDNPAMLAFLFALIFLTKSSQTNKTKFLAFAGIFYAISIASKFYMLAYLPIFLILSCYGKLMKNEDRLFSINIIFLIYSLWLVGRFSNTGLYQVFQIVCGVLLFFYFIKKRREFKNYIKLCFLDKQVLRNLAVFSFSAIVSFIIIFPHSIIHFESFLKKFILIEVSKESMGEGLLQFSPGFGMFPATGYLYYFKELYSIGLPSFLVFLFFPGVFYYTYKAFEKCDSSDYKDMWGFIVLPAVFGFLVIGIWKVWYVRYMLHLFPLFSIIGVLFLDYLVSIIVKAGMNLKAFKHFHEVLLTAITIVLFLDGYRAVYILNKVRSADNGFFLMAEKTSKIAKPGEKIGFKYWQAYSLKSTLYENPYGPYAIMMYPIPEDVILETAGGNDMEYDIIVTASPEDKKFMLLDSVSSEKAVFEAIDKYIFDSKKIFSGLKYSNPSDTEKIIHYYCREGGGYPMSFWIYRRIK